MTHRPTTVAELSEIIASTETPLHITGGGTRPIGTSSASTALSTSALSGVTLYEPGALTLVARAGTPLAEIETLLAGEGQRLAFEPMDHRPLLGTTGTPTLGGMVAANVSGPRRISAVGACRDALLGVRFVDGAGRIVANGGRVMKNVTGYDLVKLMAGSYGTLGVLTELSLKVLPAPETSVTLTARDLDDATAIAALSRALGAPWEVTGAAHLPGTGDTHIRLEGSAASMRYRAERLATHLADLGAFTANFDAEDTAALWAAIRDVRTFADTKGALWCLSVKPGDGPGLVASLPDTQALYDWGGGRIWLHDPSDTKGAAIRAAVARTGGHAARLRGTDDLPAFPPANPVVARLEQGLKARFDPRGLLNPGLMD
ncbi:glycolate oxidase subunit GlcE [Roseovarius sp.]|uniref:glycolate oxidase subunit GlcE n=1 Tax=Roseovarius sp. TaxID=1486281 RepID=UPI003513DE57